MGDSSVSPLDKFQTRSKAVTSSPIRLYASVGQQLYPTALQQPPRIQATKASAKAPSAEKAALPRAYTIALTKSPTTSTRKSKTALTPPVTAEVSSNASTLVETKATKKSRTKSAKAAGAKKKPARVT